MKSCFISETKNRFRYDANGNILTQVRRSALSPFGGGAAPAAGGGTGGLALDSLSYNYKPNTNQLTYVDDAVTTNAYTDDLDDQTTANYTYDEIGNLISDAQEQIASIEWTVYGKIKRITRTTGSLKPDLEFEYTPDGHRVCKIVKPKGDSHLWKYTYYVRDAQGNILATYDRTLEAIFDAENTNFNDVNAEFIALRGNAEFRTLIQDLHPPATSSGFIDSLRIHILAAGKEDLFILRFNPSAILTANSTLYNSIFTDYDPESLANAFISQYGASNLYDNLCADHPIPFMEHCITQGATAYLTALGAYDETLLQIMYEDMLGYTPAPFPNISTMAAGIISNWTPSQIATWVDGNGGCSLNYSILSQYYSSSNFVATAAAYTDLKTAITNQYTTAQIITAISTGKITSEYTWGLMHAASSSGYLIGELFTADPAACYLVTLRYFTNFIAQVQTANNYYSLTSYFNNIKTVHGLHVYNALVSKFIYLSNQFKDRFVLSEWHMYGSSRLGIHRPAVMSSLEQFGKTSHQTGRELVTITFNASWSSYQVNYADTSNTQVTTYTQNYEYFSVTRGTKNYELSNHLGNVLAVISDKKLKICSSDTVNFYMPDLLQATDYSAFGAPLPGRTWLAPVLDTTVVLNNDFSTTGLQGWIKTDNATVTNSTNKLNITTSGIEEGVYRKLTVEKGKTYHARVYLDRNGATCNFYLLARYAGSTFALKYITTTTPGYHEITFQAPATEIELWVITAAAPGSSIAYYVDDVTVVMDNEDGKNYRFGFNSHEKTDEIARDGNHTTAVFGEYDTRLGRRWNIDPKPYAAVSPYATFANNPILLNDILLDTPSVSTRIWGGLKVIGGLLEMTGGAVGGGATSWTGVGAVAGGLVVVHGADVTSAGFMQMLTGEEQETLTHQGVNNGLQAAGVSPQNANTAATIVDLSFSLGGGVWSVNTMTKAQPFLKAPTVVNTTNAAKGGNLVKIETVEGDVMIFSSKIGTEKVQGVSHFVVKDGKLYLNQLHLQGSSAGNVGREALWNMAKDLGKQYNVKEVIIQGGKRTTGKYKGTVPSPITIKVD